MLATLKDNMFCLIKDIPHPKNIKIFKVLPFAFTEKYAVTSDICYNKLAIIIGFNYRSIWENSITGN